MKITSAFVREQKRYSKSDLIKLLHLKTSEVSSYIEKLKSYGILKAVKNSREQLNLSDLIENDVELSDVFEDNDDYLYVFTYVGIVMVGNKVIKCYPKYILSSENPVSEMKQVLKVIAHYSSKEQIINMYNGNDETSSFNMLAVILYLINDFHDYGIYTYSQDVVEINGQGEILWDKTINDAFVLIRNNRPYYTELYTSKTVDDDFDFFKRVHECILTQCSKQLTETALLELFDMELIELTEEKLEEIADIDYIKYRLLSELNVQFNTRKQLLLKTMYAYLENSKANEDMYGLSLYGTNSFNLIWEDVCSEVLGNKLHMPVGKLKLPVKIDSEFDPKTKLIDIIDKPIWIATGENSAIKEAKETLIPDLINVDMIGGEYRFVIFDAKYYNIQLQNGKPLRSYPGVGDVTKQYLYQLAYKDFIEKHNISFVDNVFLMPTEEDKFTHIGIARMKMLSNLGLRDISVWKLSAKQMYSKYLVGKTLKLDLFYTKI